MSSRHIKNIPSSFLLAIIGARGHYAVARILQNAGLLRRFHTDVYARSSLIKFVDTIPSVFAAPLIKKLVGRSVLDLPQQKVVAHQAFGLQFGLRRYMTKESVNKNSLYLWAGKKFCESVLKHGLEDASAVYGCNSASLEIFKEAKARGMKTVLEQTIAPKWLEANVIIEEMKMFPEVADSDAERGWELFSDREQEEWELADVILCPSKFVKQGIEKAGGPLSRTRWVPYGVEIRSPLPLRIPPKTGKLRILFVGEVGIRKGAHRLLLAARELLNDDVEIRMVGSIALPADFLDRKPANVHLFGPVPRSEIVSHYQWADVLCLPSLCEGSAMVTYEAMSMGVPVVCTFSSGSLVRDGVEGFIIDDSDPIQSIVKAIRRCRDEGERLSAPVSHEISYRGVGYSFQDYEKRLVSELMT